MVIILTPVLETKQNKKAVIWWRTSGTWEGEAAVFLQEGV